MSDAVAEIACGSIAGVVGKLVEYPFDTAKVRLQTQNPKAPQFSGPWNVVSYTVRNEGFQGLYRGISLPMAGAAAENAVLFFTYKTLARVTDTWGLSPIQQALLCGSGAGLAASLVLTPVELVKCQVQVAGLTGGPHKSMRSFILQVLAENSGTGMWRGQLGTAIREAGGSAAWFGTYRYVTNWFSNGDPAATPKAWQAMAAGASGGVMYNLSLYPADTIKSRMQTDAVLGRQPQTFVRTAAELWRQGGLRALYSGCGITCARAAPSSALIFLTYEKLAAAWDSMKAGVVEKPERTTLEA